VQFDTINTKINGFGNLVVASTSIKNENTVNIGKQNNPAIV